MLQRPVNRIVGTVVALLFTHSLISYQWDRSNPVAASQWEQNTIRSERFLYGATERDCVLVGSSMSANLPLITKEPQGSNLRIINLAYAAGSPLTGLYVVELADFVPKCLLVEANLAYKAKDDKQIEKLRNPVWLATRKYIQNFRCENKPLNMLRTLLSNLNDARRAAPLTIADAKPREVEKPAVNTASEERVMARVDGINQVTEQQLLKGARLLLEAANRLEAKGTKVIFFEMPGERRVRESPYYKQLRSLFDNAGNNLPDNVVAATRQLHIIEIDHASTRDGIHLDAASLSQVPQRLFELIRL